MMLFHYSYIDIVAGLAVTNKGLIVAVDSVSPTVFIISEDGNLIHWFDCSDFMREPSDIAINGMYDPLHGRPDLRGKMHLKLWNETFPVS